VAKVSKGRLMAAFPLLDIPFSFDLRFVSPLVI